MEIIKSVSMVALGFVPTLLLLEVGYRLRIGRKKPAIEVEKVPLLTRSRKNIRSTHKAMIENPLPVAFFFYSIKPVLFLVFSPAIMANIIMCT